MTNSLTKEQTLKLSQYRDEWIAIGLDTKQTDREKTEYWMKLAYKEAGLDAPKKFNWYLSPNEAVLAAMWSKVGSEVGSKVWSEVWSEVWSKVWSEVWSEVGSKVWSKVEAEICWGQHDAGFLSEYAVYLKELGLKECERLTPRMELAKECGWFIPYKDEVFISEKPCEIHLNHKGQLHNPVGPALLYKNGYCLYSIDGNVLDDKEGFKITKSNLINSEVKDLLK